MTAARGPFEILHQRYVYDRRVRVLAGHLTDLLPAGASVLDIGCGDGRIAHEIVARRPDLTISGVDVLLRPRTSIPVVRFDGLVIPFPSRSFDVALLVDVLHHTSAPDALLAEAARVARQGVVIKDHLREGVLAGPTLRFMDDVGNRRHSVAVVYNYRSRAEWLAAFSRLGLTVDRWTERLSLYRFPLRLLFDRSLHYVARLPLPPS